MITIGNNPIDLNSIGLTLILFANICFYNQKMVFLFRIISALGIICIFISFLVKKQLLLHKKSYPIWIFTIYSMFIFYQVFALRAGDFNWDTLIWRAVESLCIYYVIISSLRSGKKFDVPFIVSGLLSVLILLKNELSSILSGNLRVGTTLSGNVNTVGFAFGVISLVIMWTYCQEEKKDKFKMVLFFMFVILMLTTGSKKTLIYLLANIVIYFYYNKEKISGWLKIGFIVCVLLYAIFQIDYFYNIIGYRVVDAVETFAFGKDVSRNVYSYSTDVRNDMIKEAFLLFKEHPIFGGGYNYFAYRTIYNYGYSHCNYTELLCCFGLFGTFVFYSRHIYQLKYTFMSYFFHNNYDESIMLLGFVFTLLILATEIAAVTFSAQSLWYLPITISAACYDYLRENSINLM